METSGTFGVCGNRSAAPDSDHGDTSRTHVSEKRFSCSESAPLETAMRRLYIGGLNHSVTQKDLKDRFGKFGEVEDVEVRTRRDDDGVPYKTFSYININISDADLKKCMTVLNKSKWKGGILQIEPAKESFLHKLAEERQELAEQRLQPPVAEDKRQKMLDSLSKAGVENFTMKAAVPGTEIPGHKDWVVSKFGRVLPVLQLQNQKGSRARTVKYDPSKYSHNIRKLDRTDEHEPTPVTQLTWEVEGGDDDISKKRRGEFPPFEPPRPKKSRNNTVNSHDAVGKTRLNQTPRSDAQPEPHHFTNGYKSLTNHRAAERTETLFTASDMDSDEEICKMMAAQNNSHHALGQDVDEDNLEVVGLDYLEKSGQARQKQKDDEEEHDYDSADTDELFASRKPPPQTSQESPTGNNTDRKKMTKKKSKAAEEKEDSSEDEEELSSRKPSSTQEKRDSGKQKQKKKTAVLPVVKPPSSESDSDDEDEDEEELESAGDSSDDGYDAMFSNVMHLEISFADLQRLAEESQETPAPSILGANLTEQSAPKKGTTPDEILAALMEDDSSEDEQKKKKKKKKKAGSATPLPAFLGTRALDEGSVKDECQKRRKEEEEEEEEVEESRGSEVKKQKLNSEAPQLNHGEKESSEEEEEEEEEVEEEEEKGGQVVKKVAAPPKAKTDSSSSSDDAEEEEEEVKVEKIMATPKASEVAPPKSAAHTRKAETNSSSSSDDDEEEEGEKEEEESQAKQTSKATAKTSPSSSSSSEEDEAEQKVAPAADAVKAAPPPAPHSESSSSEDEDEEEEEKEVKQAPLRKALGAKEEEEQQRKANLRRLAAVQQRQKEAEEHKKLIQGALSNTDAPTRGAGKHIVFGSDDDDDEDDDDVTMNESKKQTTSVITQPKKMLIDGSQSEDEDTGDEASVTANKAKSEKVRQKTVPQLFGGSEDEDDGDDDDEDSSRFDIRPQFEGEAGQKLMELQSRFGTDERFRMDSRFLDEEDKDGEETERKKSVTDDEELLEEERKKNLSILQSLLGGSSSTSSSIQQTGSSKSSVKAKTFRDVSALHYDPSKEEHAVFETKQEEIKESKSARKKKREEAEKLPEVSKEIYYDVSTDLKAVFGSAKEEVAEKTSWDQEEEEEKEEEEEEGGGGESEEPSTLSSSLLSADLSAAGKESGFKFSFFDDATETGSGETAGYKVESLQAPKVSWQQDPRFHDSSSDEEEEEEEEKEEEEQSSIAAKTTEEEAPTSTDLFFFYPEDSRLTEGPRLFCRPSQLEEQREQWEETRTALRQEYRKKHKDARRKMKPSHKS